MNVEMFKVTKKEKVSAAISKFYPTISYGLVRKLFRNKDVKVNGKRVSDDVIVNVGDEICFYIKEDVSEKLLDVVFEDENIVVVFKPRNIETVSENDIDLKQKLELQIKTKCFAVHRLDRNTQGLVIFAKNEKAKEELDLAFKNRTIEKFYLALVYGLLSEKQKNMIAYLKKDSAKSMVFVSDECYSGYEKIQTNYKVLEEFDDKTLIEVELVTGKTHQIRAHFAHIGHFVVGDEKYGDSKINRLLKKKYQCLCAYKIIFNFNDGCLKYLNGKEICLEKNKIDFCQNL